MSYFAALHKKASTSVIKTLQKLTTVKLTSSTYNSLSTNATTGVNNFLKNQTATNEKSTVTSKKAHISPNVSADTTGDIINTTIHQFYVPNGQSSQNSDTHFLRSLTCHQQNFPLYYFVMKIRNLFKQCPKCRQNVVSYYKHGIA